MFQWMPLVPTGPSLGDECVVNPFLKSVVNFSDLFGMNTQ